MEQACKSINGRAPLRKEEGIDYEIDTEDELEEEEAEDINEEEEEEEEEGDEAASFMVPDGYLSADEHSDRERDNFVSNYSQGYSGNNKPQISLLDSSSALLPLYAITSFEPECLYPLKVNNKKDLVNEQDKIRSCLEHDLHAIQYFLSILHGSYQSKPDIINQFVTKYPASSKNLANKKLQEFSKKIKFDSEKRVTIEYSFLATIHC